MATVMQWLVARRRTRLSTPTMGDHLYRLYLVVLFGGPTVWVVREMVAHDALTLRGLPRSTLIDWLPSLLPALLTAAMVTAMRFGTWQGPVVLAAADTRWLLSSPLDRTTLLRGPLARGLGAGTALGVLAGVLVALAAELWLGTDLLAAVVVLMPAGAGFGGLSAAAAWFVEASPRAARLVWRLSPVVLIGVMGLGVVWRAMPPAALWWWGPPGWAAVAVLDAAGVLDGAAASAVALLVATATAAAGAAVHRAGTVPFEQLALRATFGASFRASMYFLDLRAAGLARRGARRAVTGQRTRRLPPFADGRSFLVWAHVLIIARSGQLPRLCAGAAIVALVHAVAVTAASGSALLACTIASVLSGYVAATALIEPVWAEREQRVGQRALPQSFHQIVCGHLLIAAALLSVATAIGLGGVALISRADPSAAAVTIMVASLWVLAAALVATGQPPDVSLLLLGHGPAVVLAPLLRGPVAALVLSGPPLFSALSGRGVGTLVAWVTSSVVVMVLWLRHRIARVA